MKYDDASWHYGGDFPGDLPLTAGATHIGMFLAWMLLNNLASEALLEDASNEISLLRERTITGVKFLIDVLDEKLTDRDFSDDGNAFAVAYYQGMENDSRYIDDYLEVFCVSPSSLYGVKDTWGNYDKLAASVDRRFADWKALGSPKFII